MKILLFNWNGIMDDLAVELKSRGHEVNLRGLEIDGWKKFDILVFWNEIESQGWADLIRMAQKKGKKTILIQHGRRGTSRIFPPFNEGLKSDIVFVWGEADKDRLLACGISENKIRVVGCPLFQRLKPREYHKGINIVFSLEHWPEPIPENPIIASELRKLPSKYKVITKGLVGENLPIYDNIIVSDRSHPSHFKIVSDILAIADVVVGSCESTFELLAESLDIPVVAYTKWIPKSAGGDNRYKEYKRIYSNGCYQVDDIYKLNDTIKKAIKHPKRLREERRQAVINDGGINISEPVKKMADEIEKIWNK